MNFLSHFYFERFAIPPERVVGCILPDLLKNADKSYIFHPQKFEEQLFAHPLSREIAEGWYRHVEVDKLFHSSEIFIEHCHVLRRLLDPVLKDLPIRGTFMAHIAVELLLDHLLIEHQLVNVNRFYEHLEQVNRTILKQYLEIIGLDDTRAFFGFYDKFLEWKYIYDYQNLDQLSKPLFSICRRLWEFEVTSQTHENLTEVLQNYKQEHLLDFKEIYTYIQDKLIHI